MRSYYRGPRSDHFDGVRFFNPGHASTDRSLIDLLRWRFTGKPAAWGREAAAAGTRPEGVVAGVAVTLIGHASVLIQVTGCNVLVDPVWSERASPVGFAGPLRFDAPGVAFEDLPAIHAVLLTHSHYDHMDLVTLTRLQAGHAPRFVAPLGNDAVLGGALPGARIVTVDWGDGVALSDAVGVSLHPAYHWSARSPFDRRRALWGGFVLTSEAGPVYVVGDTGYGDGAPFRLVRERFGAPVVAIVPIGAYEPRWFMRAQHVNPEEAVRILLDCEARQGLGVHWGTFQLTDETRLAPMEGLAAACARHGVDPARFRAMRPGEVWRG